jgi:Flp pilus assembly protein TadB
MESSGHGARMDVIALILAILCAVLAAFGVSLGGISLGWIAVAFIALTLVLDRTPWRRVP